MEREFDGVIVWLKFIGTPNVKFGCPNYTIHRFKVVEFKNFTNFSSKKLLIFSKIIKMLCHIVD